MKKIEKIKSTKVIMDTLDKTGKDNGFREGWYQDIINKLNEIIDIINSLDRKPKKE